MLDFNVQSMGSASHASPVGIVLFCSAAGVFSEFVALNFFLFPRASDVARVRFVAARNAFATPGATFPVLSTPPTPFDDGPAPAFTRSRAVPILTG
jgi:hypothetical protein